MHNKLFLVCPFSCMENFIRTNYGADVFFITAMATVSQFHEIEYTEVIKNVIACENINQIFIVNDTSCRFINRVLNGEKTFGTAAEKNIQNIFINNYSFIMHQSSEIDKAKALAELNIKHQAFSMMENELFKPQITRKKIHIKGLITTKSENKIVELKLHTDKLYSLN